MTNTYYFHFNHGNLYSSTDVGRYIGFTVQKTSTNIPIYLTRGGNIYEAYGSLFGAGYAGHYWSSTAYVLKLWVYDIGFNSLTISASAHDDRWDGFMVQKTLRFFYISNSWRWYTFAYWLLERRRPRWLLLVISQLCLVALCILPRF